jgi:hypothetical protein
MPARDLGLYGAFKVTRFLIGKLEQFIEIANLRRGVSYKRCLYKIRSLNKV